jgi:hypothetical protein
MRMSFILRVLVSLALVAGCSASSAEDHSAASTAESRAAATPDDKHAAAPSADEHAAAPSAGEQAVAGTGDVRAAADQLVDALARHDMAAVAAFVASGRGVRFSPYAYVDTTSDRVVAAKDVADLWASTDSARWGSYDGSGEPILLPYAAYHAKFVYDVDFQHAPRVAVDSQPIGRGNSTNNIADVYRGASIVEYHWPGRDPGMSGMDWRSLWLVFTREQSRWHLVGIVHGAWTI